jgi:TIR domain-containing protein
MRVFISHARGDSHVAEELARAIARRGHDVVARDSTTEALQNADAMVVLISGQSHESPFVQREIEFALETPRFAGRLIPVVLGTTSAAPWILRKLKHFQAGSDLAQTGRRVAEALERTT